MDEKGRENHPPETTPALFPHVHYVSERKPASHVTTVKGLNMQTTYALALTSTTLLRTIKPIMHKVPSFSPPFVNELLQVC